MAGAYTRKMVISILLPNLRERVQMYFILMRPFAYFNMPHKVMETTVAIFLMYFDCKICWIHGKILSLQKN